MQKYSGASKVVNNACGSFCINCFCSSQADSKDMIPLSIAARTKYMLILSKCGSVCGVCASLSTM